MVNLPLGHKLARFIPVTTATVIVVLLTAWVLSDPFVNLETDWTAFDNAGERLLAGEPVYRPFSEESEPLPYFYPPFVLWLALPLAYLGFFGSFAASALLTLVANLVGIRLFGKGEGPAVDATTGTVIAVASGTTIGATLIGQYSGLYVMAFGVALAAHRRGFHALSGVALAMLWIKPNIAVAVPVVLIWSRSWRSLSGFGAGSACLLLLSLPFGLGRWWSFRDNVANIAELQEQGAVPIDKMVTALSSIQTTFGLGSSTSASLVIWLPIAGTLGIAILMLWTPKKLSENPLRAFGALCLFVVAANPRMYFYDGALITVGTFGVWLSARTQSAARTQRILTILGAVTWVGLWGVIFIPWNVIVGPTAAVTLLVVAVDCRRTASSATVIETTRWLDEQDNVGLRAA